MGIKKTVKTVPGSVWRLRTSGTTQGLNGISFGNNTYITVGNSGTIRISTNTIIWTARTSTFGTSIIDDVLFSNNFYIAVGGNTVNGILSTSTDTIVWTLRTVGTTVGNPIYSVSFGNSTYVIGCQNGVLKTSTDTIVWTLRTTGQTNNDISNVDYANNFFFTPGLRISTDGIVWIQQSLPGGVTFASVVFANNFYTAFSNQNNIVSTSTNRIVWTLRTSGTTATADNLIYGNNIYVVSFTNGSISTSTDSIVWEVKTSNNINSVFGGSVYGNNLFVVAGQNGTIITSLGNSDFSVLTDGLAVVNGDRITGITSTTDANDVASKFYTDTALPVIDLSANAGKFYTTTDGITASWDYVSNYQEFTTPGAQTFTLPPQANLLFIEAVGGGSGGEAGRTLNSGLGGAVWILRTSGIDTINAINLLAYGNNTYVYASASGILRTSTDTIIWTARTFGSANSPSSINFANNLFISNGFSGELRTSTNAIVWEARTSGTSNNLRSKSIFENNTYIIVGDSGNIITSTDTIVWTARTSGTTAILYGLTYRDNTYVSVGQSGRINVSTDTIVWTARTSGTSSNIFDITYGNGIYVTSGLSNSYVSTSTNAIIWIARTVGSITTSFAFIVYGNNVYVTGGSTSGSFSTSTNAIEWTTINTTRTYNSGIYANNTYLVGGSGATIYVSAAQQSGSGGQAGSYTSWYIPRNIVYSNLTINPGAGGTGGTTDGASGAVGSATTISWTGPNNQPYTLTASPTEANTAASSSSFYTTAGLSGANPQFLLTSSGVSATNQTDRFQPTGGGSGALDAGTGGSGGAVYQYGATIQASGGTDGNNGSNATAVTGLTYGLGAGGGGASVSATGNGGNGVRGGGGGGGAVSGTLFGNGGNGGDGYVKITWW